MDGHSKSDWQHWFRMTLKVPLKCGNFMAACYECQKCVAKPDGEITGQGTGLSGSGRAGLRLTTHNFEHCT